MTVHSAAKISGALLAAVGFLVLGAYAAGAILSLLFPPPWSCVAFLAAGSSLWLATTQSRGRALWAERAAALLVLTIGVVSWGESLAGSNVLGLDTLLFPRSLLSNVPHPGRPAPISAFNFVMLGAGLIMISFRNRVARFAGELCGVACFTFCYLSLVGFVLGSTTRQLMLPPTATLLLCAAATLLICRQDGKLLSLLRSEGPAGIIARWLMPVPLILPALTSLVRNGGQSLGLFDSRVAGSILSFADILVAILIVWGSSTQVQRVDRLRRKAEEDLRLSRDELDLRVRIRTQELLEANERLQEQIAERQRAERELQLTNATLTNVIETSPLAICAFTADGTVRKRNRAAEAMLSADAPEIVEVIGRAARGETITALEVTRKMPKGPPLHLNVWASPLFAPDERQAGILMMGVDVSERKAFENQLRHTQKLESLGVLAGGIAHDFNNLLTGIMGNASLVVESLSGTHPSRNFLNQIVSASQRAADLTRQLLAYAGKGRFVLEHLNVSELVSEIASLIQASVPKTVHLRLELQKDIPSIEADASQIQQVVMNLVINGCEAIPESGTVVVATGCQELDDQYIRSYLPGDNLAPGAYVWLEVVDTGIGMDEETRSRIFDPFFTTKFTGRGLGLAAVQGIIRGHKGALRVYSALRQGTTFKLFFPATGKQVQAAPRVLQASELRGSGTVLVIDDETIVRETARSALERLGYQVEVAETGEDGIRLFGPTGEKFTAVLLDLTMPGLSGQETFRRLRLLNPNVPVILSSGFNETEVARQFTGKGLAGFIQKPYTVAQLAASLGRVLKASSQKA